MTLATGRWLTFDPSRGLVDLWPWPGGWLSFDSGQGGVDLSWTE